MIDNNDIKETITLSYDDAIQEIEQLLDELERGGMPIDQVLDKSRRVVALITHCRAQIQKVGEEVNQILKSLKDGEND